MIADYESECHIKTQDKFILDGPEGIFLHHLGTYPRVAFFLLKLPHKIFFLFSCCMKWYKL